MSNEEFEQFCEERFNYFYFKLMGKNPEQGEFDYFYIELKIAKFKDLIETEWDLNNLITYCLRNCLAKEIDSVAISYTTHKEAEANGTLNEECTYTRADMERIRKKLAERGVFV